MSASQASRKAFVPLENNPTVMTSLLHNLGLSKTLQFHDVFSIDEPELLAFIPRPALALLLVFPVSEAYKNARNKEDSERDDIEASEKDIIWYKQTISNACGLMALLHAASNGYVRSLVAPGSDLDKLIKEALPLTGLERAKLLETSEALERAHAVAAQEGDTSAPEATADIDLHFVCFVKSTSGRLLELDGSRKGPIDRGLLAEDEDILSSKALDAAVRPFLKREEESGAGEGRFSLIALAQGFDD